MGVSSRTRVLALRRLRSPFRRRAIVRGRRGGFFKDVFRGVKKAVSVVGRLPVVGAVAKTVVSSVPVLGGVVTAVGAVKSALHPPTVANTGNTTATTGAPPVGQPPLYGGRKERYQRGLRKPRKRRSKKRATPRASRKKRSSRGVSAKQRAARARFARAAKKGPIKKGARL